MVGGSGSHLSGGQYSTSSEFWGIYGFGMALSSLFINAKSCVPVLLEDWKVYLALELADSWVELGLSVGMEALGWALVY